MPQSQKCYLPAASALYPGKQASQGTNTNNQEGQQSRSSIPKQQLVKLPKDRSQLPLGPASGSPNEQSDKTGNKDGKKQTMEIASWTKFFKRFRFFGKHFRNFIRIDIVANSVDGKNDNYLEWLGFVESKLFILLNYISKEEQVSEIRAYPYSFKNKQAYELGLMDTEISKYQFVDIYFFGFALFCQGAGMMGPYGQPQQ